MKKEIKTKMSMSRIANQIVASIEESMKIYGEYAAVVEKSESGEDSVMVEVYNPNTYILTSAEVESVQEVLEPFRRVYSDNVSCVFDTKHLIYGLGTVSVPKMEILVFMSK